MLNYSWCLDSAFSYDLLFGRDIIYENKLRLILSKDVQLKLLTDNTDKAFEILNIDVVETKGKSDIIMEQTHPKLKLVDKTKLLQVFREVDNTETEPITTINMLLKFT